MEIAAAFVTIRPETSSFESELVGAVGGTEVEVPVAADTSAAEAAIESVPDGEADLTVNTDQAEQGLDEVKDKIDETTSSTNTLGDAAQGALSGMGGLGGAAGGAANALGSTAVAGGAAAAGLFTFAQAGLEAAGAAPRFDVIAGPMADQLDTIDVGGLSGDIGELALQLGSSDEAMLNATASFVTFAQSTGATNDQLNDICFRYGARIKELRDEGHRIEREHVMGGCYRYVYQGPPAALPMPGTFVPRVGMPVYTTAPAAAKARPSRTTSDIQQGGLF